MLKTNPKAYLVSGITKWWHYATFVFLLYLNKTENPNKHRSINACFFKNKKSSPTKVEKFVNFLCSLKTTKPRRRSANTKASRDFPNHRSKATAENPKHPEPINEMGSTNFHQTETKNKKERFLQSGDFSQRKPQLPIANCHQDLAFKFQNEFPGSAGTRGKTGVPKNGKRN